MQKGRKGVERVLVGSAVGVSVVVLGCSIFISTSSAHAFSTEAEESLNLRNIPSLYEIGVAAAAEAGILTEELFAWSANQAMSLTGALALAVLPCCPQT